MWSVWKSDRSSSGVERHFWFTEDVYKRQVKGFDENEDLAVVSVATKDVSDDTMDAISVAKIGSSDDLKIGEQVVAIGNALGYGQSVTTGIVSAKTVSYTHLRSKAVFTGLEDFPRPAAIAVVDKKIQAVLPWDFQRDKDYADWPLYDYGEKMIMSSFLDAHTHLFSGAVDGRCV